MKRKHLKYSKYTFLFLILSVVFYSCTASEKSVDTSLPLDELKNRVNKNSFKISSLDAFGSINIDTPEESNSGSITVSLYKPDSLYAKIQGPFGITAAIILVTRQNFVYYNVLDNHVIKGPSTPLNIGAILRIRMNFDDILNAFSGSFILNNVTAENSQVKADNGNYLLITDNGTEIKKYWIDPEHYYITKYTVSSKATGKEDLIIEYNEFGSERNIYFPKKIDISRPNEKQFVYLSYSEKEFNKNKLDYKLVIPKSAKVTEWD